MSAVSVTLLLKIANEKHKLQREKKIKTHFEKRNHQSETKRTLHEGEK